MASPPYAGAHSNEPHLPAIVLRPTVPTTVNVYGKPEAARIAEAMYAWLSAGVYGNKAEDHEGGYIRLSAAFVKQIRRDLGVDPWTQAAMPACKMTTPLVPIQPHLRRSEGRELGSGSAAQRGNAVGTKSCRSESTEVRTCRTAVAWLRLEGRMSVWCVGFLNRASQVRILPGAPIRRIGFQPVSPSGRGDPVTRTPNDA
jgi:hypothetical protein